jgi:hypothetical protein
MLELATIIENRTNSLLSENESNGLKRDICHFLYKHPYAKFSGDCVYYATDYGKNEIRESFQDFVLAGILNVTTEHNTSFYSLTTDEELRNLALTFTVQRR